MNEVILKDLEQSKQNADPSIGSYSHSAIQTIRDQLLHSTTPGQLYPDNIYALPLPLSEGIERPAVNWLPRGPQCTTQQPVISWDSGDGLQLVSRGTDSSEIRPGADCSVASRTLPAMEQSKLVFPPLSVKKRDWNPEAGPKLVITEQPKQRGMRFRYECEGRSAGSIPGENTNEHNKTLPTVQIQNWQGEVRIVVSLVTKDRPFKPHPHSLVGKDCQNGICEVTVSPKCNMKASFSNLGIQCVKKKEVLKAIELRQKLGIDPYNVGDVARCIDDIDMNVVRLCFQAHIVKPHPINLEPVLSDPIYDKKATNTSELRICRLNKDCGSCTGGEELFLLCDKVQKEDIAIVFSTKNWEAKGVFSQSDVHRQIAIVFKTPPYCDIEIEEQASVELRLYRPSDKEYSDPFIFRYQPKQIDIYGVSHKCKRKVRFPPINTFMDNDSKRKLSAFHEPIRHYHPLNCSSVDTKMRLKKPSLGNQGGACYNAQQSYMEPEEEHSFDNSDMYTAYNHPDCNAFPTDCVPATHSRHEEDLMYPITLDCCLMTKEEKDYDVNLLEALEMGGVREMATVDDIGYGLSDQSHEEFAAILSYSIDLPNNRSEAKC
uniref:Transcription factor RelB-like protein n=1 Tax=Callorhinchus milii TaxID=7868 RepID=V9KLL7_CALMI